MTTILKPQFGNVLDSLQSFPSFYLPATSFMMSLVTDHAQAWRRGGEGGGGVVSFICTFITAARGLYN